MLPLSFSVMGQLWHSPWLDSVSRLVSDSNVSDFKISKVINSYQVINQVDYNYATMQIFVLFFFSCQSILISARVRLPTLH